MSLIFYGKHSADWLDTLSVDLLPSLSPIITNIYNHHNYCHKLQLQSQTKLHYILPLLETHMIDLYARKIKAMMPELETIKTFMCKKKFHDYVINNNLLDYIPKTYTSIDDIPNAKRVITKPYNLNSGSGMHITTRIREKDFINRIVQEYLTGNKEYCAYIVAKNGKIQLCIVYEYTFEKNMHIKTANNNMTMEKIILDQKYINQLELFLLPCLYNGICNMDFKMDNNLLKVLEINPRLGGSLMKSDEVIKKTICVFN